MNLERINELARKERAEGLTPEEKAEQAGLRQEYISSIRANLRAQLNNIDIREEDGTVVNLGEKYGREKTMTLNEIGKEQLTRRGCFPNAVVSR